MSAARTTMTLAAAAMFIISAHGQGFLNLDFESAQNLPGSPGNGEFVLVSNALPNWHAYDGSAILSEMFYVSNNFLGSASAVELEAGSLSISGNDLSVGLYTGGSISQSAVVPASAESLEFEAQGPGPSDSIGASGFEAILGGQTLSLSATYDGPDYIEYGANIPADMDGQTEALTFLIQGGSPGGVLLDNIQFSTSPIPEPGEWALIGVGTMVFSIRTLLRTGLRGARRNRRGSIAAGKEIWTG